MFRESLETNSGMLFIFDDVQKQSFHMTETKIPLDIAFIREDGIIESIKELEPFDESAVYSEGDVFYLGHNHQLYAKPMHSLRIIDNKEHDHRRWYCRGGSFLSYADYARYSFFPMARTGWVTIEFKENEINAME